MADDTHNEITGGVFFSTVIQGRDITVQLPPQVEPALSGLPARSPAFTGRDNDLEAVLAPLAPHPDRDDGPSPAAGTKRAVVTAVGGLAGIGKTELAVQAAHTALARGWCPGGVLFVDLFGYDPARRLDPGRALDGFLRALGFPAEHIPPDTQDRARLYTSILATYAGQGRRILVIVDNASTHRQARPLLPTDGLTATLVTSRHTLGLLDARLIDLDVLAPQDAVDLLWQVLEAARLGDTRITEYPEDAAKVAGLCGGLPLALRIIAALLAEDPARPLWAMATDLAGARLEEMEYTDADDELGVRAAFDLSYRHLPPEQARLFRLLPLNPGPDISTQTAAVLADADQTTARRTLEALARAHLIEHGTDYGRWRIHDLVRLFADQQGRAAATDDQRDQAFTAMLERYLSATFAATRHLDPTDTDHPRAAMFENRSQALTWLDTEHPNLVAAVHAAAEDGPQHRIVRALPALLSGFFTLRGRFDDQIALSTRALHASRRLGERDAESRALCDLGNALAEVRRFDEAITVHQQDLTVCRESGDRHGEGRALNSLGVALAEVRRVDEAITTLQDAVAICRETDDRHGEGAALGNLGFALLQAGRFDEAITVHQQDLTICRETGDRHGEGHAFINLGSALIGVGRVDEAITILQDAVAVFRETGDRRREGGALNSLSAALHVAGRSDEAITAHSQAAHIHRAVGDRHAEGQSLVNLGNIQREAERFDESITALHDAAIILAEAGDRHSEGNALGSLGLALIAVGRVEEAITAYQDALAMFHETHDRYSEAQILGYLGRALVEAGHLDEAIPTLHQAVPLFRETGNPDGEGYAFLNLGLALAAVGRVDEAITAYQDAAALFRETGDRHGEGTTILNLGLAQGGVDAITTLQDAVTIVAEAGDRHGEGRALAHLGLALAAAGRFGEAISVHEEAAQIFRETGDQDAEDDVLRTLNVFRKVHGPIRAALTRLMTGRQRHRKNSS